MVEEGGQRLRVVLVGAGSVGQVYGRHLQQGGAEVRYLVRPKYVAHCTEGFVLHRFRDRKPVTSRFVPDRVSSDAAEAAQGGVDVVVLCMSYAGLQGPWLDELLTRVGDASVLSLVPGLPARAWLLERIPEKRLMGGIITLLAYPAPMEGQDLEPGTAYWFPPLSPCPIDGERERAAPVVACLRAGGQPAKVSPGTIGKNAAGLAMFMPLIAALELAGWSFASMGSGEHLRRACGGAREALDLAARRMEISPPIIRHLMRPFAVRLVLWFAPKFVPFDLERFLEIHFTKVDRQTRLFLGEWVAQAAGSGAAIPHLQALADGLAQRDAGG